MLLILKEEIDEYAWGTLTLLKCRNEVFHSFHFSRMSSVRVESQSKACDDNSLSINRPSMVTGVRNPNWSKRPLIIESIPCYVYGLSSLYPPWCFILPQDFVIPVSHLWTDQDLGDLWQFSHRKCVYHFSLVGSYFVGSEIWNCKHLLSSPEEIICFFYCGDCFRSVTCLCSFLVLQCNGTSAWYLL